MESMRFVNALRQRGDHDLARAYLERLKRNASPTLAIELPLEIAKVRLLEASLEPDSNKRQAMLQEAQREFDQFPNWSNSGLAASQRRARSRRARLWLAANRYLNTCAEHPPARQVCTIASSVPRIVAPRYIRKPSGTAGDFDHCLPGADNLLQR